jgi:predicted alpha/beta-hydrolase family hydrolase
MSGELRELVVHVGERSGDVSALLLQPPDVRAVYVLAHGAGAGMRHAFMDAMAERLAERRIASFRYQFPYTEQGKRRPDPQPMLLATVRAAVAAAREQCPELPLLAGGKSMGGRMTSLAAAAGKLGDLRGIVFLGFPLHAAGKPGSARGDHLDEVELPMLFLQGTRDRLAELDLLRPICERLGARATLWIVEGGDHSFHVLKRSGRSDDEVLDELADQTAAFADKVVS